MNRAIATLAVAIFLTAGCASISEQIGKPPGKDLQLAEVVGKISTHRGQPVRWGGTIVSVSEKDKKTWVEIQQYRLDSSGAPLRQDDSEGRFLVRFDAVPEVAAYTKGDYAKDNYTKGRDITVFGTISGTFKGTIGRRSYTFPVVKAKVHRLWSAEVAGAYPDGHRLYPYRLDPYYFWGRGRAYRYGYYSRYHHPWNYYW